MGSRPEELRTEIEQTRERMAHDVDRLADHTSPKRVAQRRWEGVKDRTRSMTERVMGARDSALGTVQDAASNAGDTLQETAHGVAGTVQQAPRAVTRGTRGNPMAAGVIAFGVGLLVASLLPETESEKQAGSAVADRTGDLADKARETAREFADDLGGQARDAARSVKETARDAVGNTTEQARESGRTTVQQTRESVS